MDRLKHIPDLLSYYRSYPPRAQAFGYWKDGQWSYLSSEQFIDYIECIALALNKLNVQKGDRIGIYAKSSPYWTIVDFAINWAGAVTVPFFSNLSERHFLFEVEQSKPRILFVGDSADWELASRHRDLFESTVGIEEIEGEATTFDIFDLIRQGSEVRKQKPHLLQDLLDRLNEDDLATIIYTSGSTGTPKGVELTHRNLTCLVPYNEFSLSPKDTYLSILPLAHIFAKQIHYFAVGWGMKICFLNDLKKVGDACKEIRPTGMITVPRLLEKVYAKMYDKMENSSPIKRALGRWAFGLAHQEKGWAKTLLHPIADLLVYRKLRNALGGNFRILMSGGAALSPHLHTFFLNVGIPIVQGWGLTEGSTIAVNRLSDNHVGTVGPPMPDTDFRISDHGEVLVKGPSIMRGYYQNPEATAKAIDQNGWLHTGDQGHFDEYGHLVIEGRINDSFKTSQGEFIIPTVIEQKICESPLIDMALVVGEGYPYPSALLFPDFDALKHFKLQHHLEHLSDEELIKNPEFKETIISHLAQMNQELDHWQQIHNYRVILATPTIESRELTPTLKLRRKIIQEKYRTLIEEMYQKEIAQ